MPEVLVHIRCECEVSRQCVIALAKKGKRAEEVLFSILFKIKEFSALCDNNRNTPGDLLTINMYFTVMLIYKHITI